MLNRATIIGNLGRDPEMRYTANGTAQTTFSVAVNEKWTNAAGEKQERVEWFSVVAWSKLAEVCAQYLAKGRQVYVEGKIQTRTWDNNEGVKQYRTELIAQNVEFLGGGQRENGAGGTPGFAPPTEGDIDPDDLPF
jgi:single-strand DNA-binding protein